MAEVGGLAPSQPSPSSAAPARPFDAVGEFLVSLGVARRAGRSARCGVHRRTPRCRSIKKGSEPARHLRPPGLGADRSEMCRLTAGAGLCRGGASGLSLRRPRNQSGFLLPENRESYARSAAWRGAPGIGRGDGNLGGDRSRPSRIRIIGAHGCDRTVRARQWAAARRGGSFPSP